MAYTGYGAKYTLTFSDIFQNTTGQYIATIYRKGYSGDIVELDGNSSPLIIETDSVGGNGGYRPVIATKASLNLVINDVRVEDEWTDNTNIWELYNLILGYTGFDFTEFITAESDTFLLEVKKKAGAYYNIIWQGYYIYNTDVSLNEIMPIQFSLQFSDMLQMKNNRFYNFPGGDSNLIHYNASDKISLLDVIMRCCYYSYITNTVSIEYPFPYGFVQGYESTNDTYYFSSQETDGLASLYIQKNGFLEELGKYQTLFDVLSGICSQFGLVAYFKNNKLHIRSYDKLVNNTAGDVDTAEYTISSYNATTDKVEYSFYDYATDGDSIIPLNSGNFKNIGRDQTIRFNYPIEDVVITNSASINYNIPNYNMASISQVVKGVYAGDYYAVNSWYDSTGNELVYQDVDTVPLTMQARPFYPYAKLKTQTYGTDFATKFLANRYSGFNINNYIDSEVLDVSSGDVMTFSYSAYTDGRLKNLPATGGTYNQANMRPKPVVALIIIANDANGDETTYYYDSTTNRFESYNIPTSSGSLPLVTSSNYLSTDSDWIHYDLKAVLDIPNNGKLKVRQYQPYRGVNYDSIGDEYQLYVEYCNLQTFKGSTLSGLPSSQRFRGRYEDLINSDTSIELKSNIFLMDVRNYTTDWLFEPYKTLKAKNPIFVPNCYGNGIIDKYYMPISGLDYFNYGNPGVQ